MIQLRMEDPATRDSALAAALQDKDKTVLRAGLQAARTSFPSRRLSSGPVVGVPSQSSQRWFSKS